MKNICTVAYVYFIKQFSMSHVHISEFFLNVTDQAQHPEIIICFQKHHFAAISQLANELWRTLKQCVKVAVNMSIDTNDVNIYSKLIRRKTLLSIVDLFPNKKPLCYVLLVLDDIDLSATLQAPVKRNSKSAVTTH